MERKEISEEDKNTLKAFTLIFGAFVSSNLLRESGAEFVLFEHSFAIRGEFYKRRNLQNFR